MKGSVVKRTDAKGKNRYFVLIEDSVDGHRKRRWHSDPATRSGFTSKRAAEAYCADLVAAMGQGTYVAPSVTTVEEWLTVWLEQAKDRLKESTWASYEKNIRVHITPALGSVRLQQLTAAHLDAFYKQLRSTGRATKGSEGTTLSPRTVQYNHMLIKAARSEAVRKGLITRNPAEAATAPKPGTASAQRSVMHTWSAKELASFLEGVADHRHADLYAFLAYTGCRRGEALGLRWRDLDLDLGHAVLRQQIGKVSGRVVVGSTKDNRGRTVAIDPHLVSRLESRRIEQERERDLLGPGYDDNDLVFANPDGTCIYPEGVSRIFKEQAKRLRLPELRLHDLRHTWATIALTNGVHPKVVQERLGHASIAITLQIYSHVAPTMHDEAAAKVAGIIQAASDPKVISLRAAR